MVVQRTALNYHSKIGEEEYYYMITISSSRRYGESIFQRHYSMAFVGHGKGPFTTRFG
jgi:hypothetical protein